MMKEYVKKNMLLPEIIGTFAALAFVVSPINDVVTGLWNIQLAPSILLTDYATVGGIGATLLNSALVMLFSLLIVKQLKMNINGAVFAGILTIGGFAFFGKNVINVLIIFLGVHFYGLYKKVPLKNIVVIFLFSTGIAPISSVVMFGLGLPLPYAVPLGILVGTTAGFFIAELAAHTITFHKGFDLYNVGFAGGIIAVFFYSVIRLAGFGYQTEVVYTEEFHVVYVTILLISTIGFLVAGFVLNGYSFQNYNQILKRSGRAISDFTRNNQKPITLINAGLTGLLTIAIVLLLGIKLSGPSAGAIYMVIGFAAFGKHIKNIYPSMIGVILVALIFGYELQNITITLAIIFSTALAPLAGEKGVLIGIFAGAVHLPLVMNLSQLHGGILLYSNGFAAAFTAVIIYTVTHTLERGDEYGNA